ncbi:hypothetical protein BX600DRAFT_555387 [Xylariales sp. PMI_506]|nr:hypothetical protein BX600DRAFT_555387 [Xylariales sp. PMI_506]
MLPPINEAVFKANPEFENLYKSLTLNYLHPDGSTKEDAAAKDRDRIRSELREYRLKDTKRHLLENALSSAPPPSSQPARQLHRRTKSQQSRVATQETPQLPPELLDILMLLPSFLSRAPTLPASELEFLLSNPPFSEIPSLLHQLTPVVSSHLISQASSLTRVLQPSTNPSFVHRSIPQLVPSTQVLVSRCANNRAALSSARLSAAASMTNHLDQHTEALVHILRSIEAKHGPAAHSAVLRASEASLEAQLWATSVELLLHETRAALYPPEAQVALKNYRRHLRDAEMQLANNVRTREQELNDYGVAVSQDGDGGGVGLVGDEVKEKKMREMARIWKEMETRLKEIRGDLVRLDQR